MSSVNLLSDATITAFDLFEFCNQLTQVNPPCAYRLSLETGVEFPNVKAALEKPLATRLDTLAKLVKGLDAALFAVSATEELTSTNNDVPRIFLAGNLDLKDIFPATEVDSLTEVRTRLKVPATGMAKRIGVAPDTIKALERGGGLARNLDRYCSELGLRIMVVLPPPYTTVADIWTDKAAAMLATPSQYPVRRANRHRELSELKAKFLESAEQ